MKMQKLNTFQSLSNFRFMTEAQSSLEGTGHRNWCRLGILRVSLL